MAAGEYRPAACRPGGAASCSIRADIVLLLTPLPSFFLPPQPCLPITQKIAKMLACPRRRCLCHFREFLIHRWLNLTVLRCHFRRTRYGCDPHSAGPGAKQDPRTLGDSRSRSVNIVYEKDFAAIDCLGMRNGEGSSHVFTALVRRHADL